MSVVWLGITSNDVLLGGELHLGAREEIHNEDISPACGGDPVIIVGSDEPLATREPPKRGK